jgi:outer membrane protein OmpA-like peptidoglycan-associated protein
VNTRTLAWFVVLPVLALAPVLAGPRAREVAPAVAVPAAVASTLASGLRFVANDSLSPIHFAAGTTQIRSNDTRILDAHAAWLRGNRTQRLLIEGHTDSAGDSAFSRQVGEQRAKSAKAYLVSRGVPPDQITASSGRGGAPACGEKTAMCRAANRRATFSTEARP